MDKLTERLLLALKVYDADNDIGNDYKAYKLELSKWARGEIEEQPKRSDFGLEHYNMDDMVVQGEIV